jgi:hypothetical protein
VVIKIIMLVDHKQHSTDSRVVSQKLGEVLLFCIPNVGDTVKIAFVTKYDDLKRNTCTK